MVSSPPGSEAASTRTGTLSSALSLPSRRTFLRLTVAASSSALISLIVWLSRSTHLSPPIDIVGNPTFSNFDYHGLFLSYYLEVFGFPLGAIVIYALLYWRGPLRGPSSQRDHDAVGLIIQESSETEVPFAASSTSASRLLGVALPAAFVAVCGSSSAHRSVDLAGLVCGLVFTAAVLVAARLLLTAERRRGPVAMAFGDCVSVTSTFVGAAAAIWGLWWVSLHTGVTLHDGTTQLWPWLPWWAAVIATLCAWSWAGWRLRRGAGPVSVEVRLRVVLLGSATMFLITAALPGPLSVFTGFDDSQGVTGASLLSRGFFPWRDFQFIHGPFLDILEPHLGFQFFGHTVWGADAGVAMLLLPLTWVTIYLLGVWAAQRRSLVILAPLVLAATRVLYMDPRFVAISAVLILLGVALSSQRLSWIVSLTIVLFIEALLIPEAAFQALAVVVVLIGADVVHRVPGQRWVTTFRRTICLVVTGLLLTLAWLVFLASQHALNGFITWFVIFGPGHDASGAIPAWPMATQFIVMWWIMIGLLVVTTWSTAWRVRARRAWTPRMWVTLAAGINAALYGTQALGLFEPGHVQLSLNVGVPFALLTAVGAAPALDNFVRTRAERLKRSSFVRDWFRQPVTVAALCVPVIAVPSIASNLFHTPSQAHQRLGADTETTTVGYAYKGAIAPAMLTDFRKLVHTYAPTGAPFFDMTNAPGYFYYLLGLRPASRITNISQAVTPAAQRIAISDLRKSRPPLIAFSADNIGLPVYSRTDWGIVQAEVRSFAVSSYVLRHWTPLVMSDGVLFLLRDDLMTRHPRVPQLSEPPTTTDLYNSQAVCSWGDAANYLTSRPVGPRVTVKAEHVRTVRERTVFGWARDTATGGSAQEIVMAVDGHAVATVFPMLTTPAPVGASQTDAIYSDRFSAQISAAGPVSVYALTSNGYLHLLPGSAPSNAKSVWSGQFSMSVGSRGTGSVSSRPVFSRVSTFRIPPGHRLSDYELATFAASKPIGNSDMTVSGLANSVASPAVVGPAVSSLVTFSSLPVTGPRLNVRVGACLQWHGYADRTLYLAQSGGTPVTSITLARYVAP
jgi:hypothetical protein